MVSMSRLAFILVSEHLLALDIRSLANMIIWHDIAYLRSILASVKARSTLLEQFKEGRLCGIRDQVLRCNSSRDTVYSDSILRFGGHICVMRVEDLIRLILRKDHISIYVIYLMTTKMYTNLRKHY